eukprot:TRINITY_DN40024_c0_g1_i1.p1 TRINITY_DN40024_c0_g1~~TRINITY_DN40024_c0_g1_i1.p1  ORF type:complete len:229 (-),score=17.96 TRINITY_DN40024_c0_g1_i1:160-846(-)
MDIRDGRQPKQTAVVTYATSQLIDVFPTVMTFASVPQARWPTLDGSPLQPILDQSWPMPANKHAWPTFTDRPDFVVSQFHGDNIAMSWFLVVHDGFKLVVWGTGEQHAHQLFDLVRDPDEMINLAQSSEQSSRVEKMLRRLRSVVDFPKIAKHVAKYNQDSLRWWTRHQANWQKEMGKQSLRWHESWSYDPKGAADAVVAFLDKPASVEPCRSQRIWPPTEVHADVVV